MLGSTMSFCVVLNSSTYCPGFTSEMTSAGSPTAPLAPDPSSRGSRSGHCAKTEAGDSNDKNARVLRSRVMLLPPEVMPLHYTPSGGLVGTPPKRRRPTREGTVVLFWLLIHD